MTNKLDRITGRVLETVSETRTYERWVEPPATWRLPPPTPPIVNPSVIPSSTYGISSSFLNLEACVLDGRNGVVIVTRDGGGRIRRSPCLTGNGGGIII